MTWAVFALAALLVLYLVFDNFTVGVNRVRIPSERVKKGLRIVMVSDLHARSYFQNVGKMIARERPDLILLAGDMVEDRHHTQTKRVSYAFFRDVTKIAPVYAIFGNHERRVSWQEEVRREMEEAGIVILENRMITMPVKEEHVAILGLDEGSGLHARFHTKAPQTDHLALLRECERSSGIRIVMDHYPENFAKAGDLSYNQCAFEVMVAGHAHGGQVRLPWIGGLYAPGQGVFPRYTKGLYREKDANLVVSNGLGGQWYLPRFGNRPSVWTIELAPEKEGEKI